jgi:hypothetical protein
MNSDGICEDLAAFAALRRQRGCRPCEKKPRRGRNRPMHQGRIRKRVRMGSHRDVVVLPDHVDIPVRRFACTSSDLAEHALKSARWPILWPPSGRIPLGERTTVYTPRRSPDCSLSERPHQRRIAQEPPFKRAYWSRSGGALDGKVDPAPSSAAR